MRPSFVIMLAIGLGLMGLFWWKAWDVENEKVEKAAATLGCAKGVACPEAMPACLTGYDLPGGVCSVGCKADNQCPDFWCCVPSGDAGPGRLCAPPEVCRGLGIGR